MTFENKRVGLYTLGCKVSLYETQAIAEGFEREGFTVAPFDEVCDVYVINTCTVTAESDAKSRKYIRRAIRKNPSAVVIVVGCYSQRSPKEVSKIDGVSVVIGTQDKLKAVEYAKNCLQKSHKAPYVSVNSLEGAEFERMCVKTPDRTRAYVKIEDGCECKCTYCAISGARGPVRSKPFEYVVSEVEALRDSGVHEVVLTGIETGSYGADLGVRAGLSRLMEELDRRRSVDRIRLGSMAPELLGEDFAARVMPLSIMVPHVHVSMQSGSDKVLSAMKRRYNLAMALKNLERIRDFSPKCMFTADLMVGFPGESEEDYLLTEEFVKRARLLDAHVFAYSKREGTPAAEYGDQVPDEVKKERSSRLIALKNQVRDKVLDEVVDCGDGLVCIMESRNRGEYVGHSDSYVEVRCARSEDLTGRVVEILPIRHENGVVYGTLQKIIQ